MRKGTYGCRTITARTCYVKFNGVLREFQYHATKGWRSRRA